LNGDKFYEMKSGGFAEMRGIKKKYMNELYNQNCIVVILNI
jgi:hypothetical protein